jgi:hypothetical protein
MMQQCSNFQGQGKQATAQSAHHISHRLRAHFMRAGLNGLNFRVGERNGLVLGHYILGLWRISDKADLGLFLPYCIGQIGIAVMLQAQRCMLHVQGAERRGLLATTKPPLPSVHFGGCADRKTTAPQGTVVQSLW